MIRGLMCRSATAALACALTTVWLLVPTVGAQPSLSGEGPSADRRCLQCHGQPHIAEMGPSDRLKMVGTWLGTDGVPADLPRSTPPADGAAPLTRPGLFVLPDALAGSAHEGLSCVSCHEDAARLPHSPTLNLQTCATTCHADAAGKFAAGIHQEALQRKDPMAPTCASCHGGHDIPRTTERHAPQYRLNSLYLCADCHQKHSPTEDRADPAAHVAAYLDSTHAKAITGSGLLVAATCADCHDAHGVFSSEDPRSAVHRSNVPSTCGSCHVGVVEIYATSVHGMQHAEHNENAAVCTDCHTAHAITLASTPEFVVDVVSECGRCHDTSGENGERIGSYYETYLRSYHGQVTELGSARAARCSDCHGYHDILPLDDPASKVSSQNLVETCRSCHPGANARFVQFDPHANYRDRKNYPVLYAIWWYFIIVMTSVFTFFGLHTILWFIRSIIERRKHGRPPKHAHSATAIRRFSTLNRVNHALVVITFFGLTATGIPLVFSQEAWAKPLVELFGGAVAAGLWHRFFAAMLIMNFVLHFFGLGRAFLRRKCSWYRWIFGPNSLVPRWKDVTDCFNMFLWFFGRRRKPSFDRWTYWEKFDYWAEVFGSMIIGGTGLLLWFPELAAKVVPGWSFNIAMVIHGYEALLAIGFIFTIHFFNAHIRPDTFPVDDVIFTGSMSEEELKAHRPEEYRRLVESGQLESLRVKAPNPAKRPYIVAIAIVCVAIGVALLALIIAGGLS